MKTAIFILCLVLGNIVMVSCSHTDSNENHEFTDNPTGIYEYLGIFDFDSGQHYVRGTDVSTTIQNCSTAELRCAVAFPIFLVAPLCSEKETTKEWKIDSNVSVKRTGQTFMEINGILKRAEVLSIYHQSTREIYGYSFFSTEYGVIGVAPENAVKIDDNSQSGEITIKLNNAWMLEKPPGVFSCN